MAGYSGTPLPQKLGIKASHRVAVISAPPGFLAGQLPESVKLQSGLRGTAPLDVIVWFVTRKSDFVERLDAMRDRMASAAGLWVAWPKKASKVPTDMTEDVVRAVALPTGLVDNKVCAIDETWSALRLVIRVALRP
jgi:hypothetical protein